MEAFPTWSHMPQAPENGANGLVMTPKEDGKFFARDFKRWLQTRAQEWARGSDFAWRGKCESRFGRVPQLNHMSILELEETLIDIGDTDVTGIREQTEALHDGVVTGFLKDKSQPWGEAIACFIESYDFEVPIYCHKTHIAGWIEEGDQVRTLQKLRLYIFYKE